jgi:hypothetical protein
LGDQTTFGHQLSVAKFNNLIFLICPKVFSGGAKKNLVVLSTMAIDPTIGNKLSLPKTFWLLPEFFSKISQKTQHPIFGHLQSPD